ncbi:hypothetical protein BDN71DRAFT_1455454 [Pleurotus eryngii]|uniref:Uncharacterized protein n=1 Tax=Pleurotus eryngii TaxID=5323 RepID=A0A9P6D3M3_PLEER|nr:hypothetical protein BDN71DRAFT_1455454 [Pleurotus eryngii]
MFGVVPKVGKDGGHSSGWKFRVIPGLRLTDTGKFLVLPGLSRCELHLSSLKKDTPLAGDRAAFPRRCSARVALKACAWLTTSLESWGGGQLWETPRW